MNLPEKTWINWIYTYKSMNWIVSDYEIESNYGALNSVFNNPAHSFVEYSLVTEQFVYFSSKISLKSSAVVRQSNSTALVARGSASDSGVRDEVNFPRPVRATEPGKVRLGFLPEEW